MDNSQNNFSYHLDTYVDLLGNLQILREEGQSGDQLLQAIPIRAESSLLGLEALLQENRLVEYKHLPAESFEYKKIKKLFPQNLEILYIDQVFNPFIKLFFQLKQHFNYSNVALMKLFHGTKMRHVDSICKYNFDWRYYGIERGHKCGKGVNFTPKPKFALNFCDKNTDKKVIILADVLVINKTIGKRNMDVPPEGYDTAVREDNKTFVKFCAAEFCPQYVIYFRKRKV